jgi:hypothetical protein
MRKTTVGVLLCAISFVSVSQIKYKPGYFYNNQNQKTECLIENADWTNNPAEFNYKLHEGDELKSADISSVKEFGIYNYSKYVRGTVKIDRWAETTNRYDDSKSPKWSNEELFLRVLVDGKASLFLYSDNEITRLFYTIQDSSYDIKQSNYVFPDTSIRQLIYKRYVIKNVPGVNQVFRKQLLDDVRCDDIPVESVLNLNYGENELVDYFIKYNKCIGAGYVDYYAKIKGATLHFKLLLGVVKPSFRMLDNGMIDNTTFDTPVCFKPGVEIEYIIPSETQQWSIFIAPSYLSFHTSKNVRLFTSTSWLDGTMKMRYSFFDIPIGIRRYWDLDNGCDFFLDAAYVLVMNSNASLVIDPYANFNPAYLQAKDGSGMTLGAGFSFRNLSAEIRYSLRGGYLSSWDSQCQDITLSIGYKIF